MLKRYKYLLQEIKVAILCNLVLLFKTVKMLFKISCGTLKNFKKSYYFLEN